jgi:segregation and condensation protein B
MNAQELKNIIEAAILSAGEPLTLDRLLGLFDDEARPAKELVLECIDSLRAECAERGIELVEVGSGYRYQARKSMAPWVARLWEEKPPRYSRAFLETLALIAYRQPITRAEIEDIRGVAVATNIVKSLTERGWVRVVGHRDVPGKPAMYATTKQFLDYFNLKSLDDLPTLAELRDLDTLNEELFEGAPTGPREEPDSGIRIPGPDMEPFAL